MSDHQYYNRITFDPEAYGANTYDPKSIEDAKNDIFFEMSSVLNVLLRNGYQARVHSDGYCVMIDYNYKNPELAGCDLLFVGEDEYIGKCNENNGEEE